MKILKWIGIVFFAILVIGGISGAYKAVWLSSHGGEAPSADVRESFIQGSNESCIDTQGSNPANAALSHSVIVSYCSCVSNNIAEQITNAEIAAISKEGALPVGFQEKMDAVSKACAEITLK